MENENSNPISDELLAAFLEGKTDSAETIRVLNAIAKDSDLAELVTDAYVMDEIEGIAEKFGDDIYMEFGIELPNKSEKKIGSDVRIIPQDDSFFDEMVAAAALKGTS